MMKWKLDWITVFFMIIWPTMTVFAWSHDLQWQWCVITWPTMVVVWMITSVYEDSHNLLHRNETCAKILNSIQQKFCQWLLFTHSRWYASSINSDVLHTVWKCLPVNLGILLPIILTLSGWRTGDVHSLTRQIISSRKHAQPPFINIQSFSHMYRLHHSAQHHDSLKTM